MKLVNWFSERKSATVSTQDILQDLIFERAATAAGVQVTRNLATRVTTFLACVRVLADGIAQVPFRVMRTEPGPGSLVLRNPYLAHALYNLFAYAPNDMQTSYEFRELVMYHLCVRGNAYIWIVRGFQGKILELLPLDPGTVETTRKDWKLNYKVTFPSGRKVDVKAEDMWHIKGLSWDGVCGEDVLAVMREAIALASTAEGMSAQMYSNGARASGVLSTKADMDDDELAEARKEWKQTYEGQGNAFKTILLHGEWDYKPMGSNAADSQLQEQRRFQVEEICRGMRVLPIMIGYADKTATFASSQQMFLAHLVHTLAPWHARIENSANVHLLSETDRKGGAYTKFFTQAMMRGSMQERIQYYQGLFNMGAINPNQIRELEDMNPYEGGDQYRVQQNTVDASLSAEEVAELTKPEPAPADPEADPVDPGAKNLRLVN